MKRSLMLVALLALSGCATESVEDATPTEDVPTETPSSVDPSDETATDEAPQAIAQQLNAPWSIVRIEDGFLVSERNGTIAVIDEAGRLERQPVALDEDVLQIGEGGLLGLVKTPDFETERTLYAYHTYGTPSDVRNRVVELTWDGERFDETAVILEDIPGAQFHNGGRLVMDGDALLVTTGDALIPELAQDATSLAGKILRIPLTGEGEATDWIVSSGHRNPQGLVRIDETLYASEHGASGHDEVNVIEEGNNYGWPVIEADQTEDGLETPWFEVGPTSWAPSGLAANETTLFMATLRENRLVAINRTSRDVTTIVEGQGRIRDVLLEGDTFYYITNNTDGRGTPGPEDDQLRRVTIQGN